MRAKAQARPILHFFIDDKTLHAARATSTRGHFQNTQHNALITPTKLMGFDQNIDVVDKRVLSHHIK